MDIKFSVPGGAALMSCKGIWDTGATGTVITQNVVSQLNLAPTGKIQVNTASAQNVITDTFLVDLFLKQDLKIQGLKVSLGSIAPGVDCLIGMDIITLGDFSITNLNGNTCMTFRIPSIHELDFVKDGQRHMAAAKAVEDKEERRRILYGMKKPKP